MMKAKSLLKAGFISAAIVLSGVGLPCLSQTATQINEFHAKRYGSGNWTYEELSKLLQSNYSPTATEECGVKNDLGGYDFPDDPNCLYKDPVLGVELVKLIMEANKDAAKIDRPATSQELAIAKSKGIHVWEGMSISTLKVSREIEHSRNKLVAKGTPSTMHGSLAKITESMIEMGQYTDLCQSNSGTVNQLKGDVRMRCNSTANGDRRVRTKNSIVDIKGDGSGSMGFARNHENYADQFAIDFVRNEGDIYNIDNQEDGEVNVHARGSKDNDGVLNID